MSANEFYTNHMTTFLCHVTTSFGHHVISFLQPTVQNSNFGFTTLVILIVIRMGETKIRRNLLYRPRGRGLKVLFMDILCVWDGIRDEHEILARRKVEYVITALGSRRQPAFPVPVSITWTNTSSRNMVFDDIFSHSGQWGRSKKPSGDQLIPLVTDPARH